MHRRKPRLSIKLITVIPVIALTVLAGAISIYHRGGPEAHKSGRNSVAPVLLLSDPTGKRAWLYDMIVEAQIQRVRQDKVNRINAWLAGSPMSGLGEAMVCQEERTGVSAKLCAAVAYAESSLGRRCPSYNAWGMGPGLWFSSWADGLQHWYDNCLAHPSWAPWQTGWDIQRPPEYCESHGTTTYAENVTGLVNSI